MQADIFERPVYRSASTEQACLGAAITAAVGSGAFKSFDESCLSTVRLPREIFYPNPKNAAIYRGTYEIFRALYPANREIFHRVSDRTESLCR